jgi:hypothetical protein
VTASAAGAAERRSQFVRTSADDRGDEPDLAQALRPASGDGVEPPQAWRASALLVIDS